MRWNAFVRGILRKSEDDFLSSRESQLIKSEFERLPAGERRVLELRYSGFTLEQTAEKLLEEKSYSPEVKLTRERIRQIEVRALNRLREACSQS